MNWPEWFLAVVGAVVIFAAVTAACFALIVWMNDRSGRTHIPSYQAGIDLVRGGLRMQAHWFGEDPTTVRLIQDLADDLATTETRERWRKSRQEAKEVTA